MPNHITNRLKIIADKEKIEKIKETIKYNKDEDLIGTIDFNKIIPAPKHIYQGNIPLEAGHRLFFPLKEEDILEIHLICSTDLL